MLVAELRQSPGRIGYRTIVETVIGAIAEKKLNPGQQLPPQRDLAEDIGVAVGTVGRAYTELESQGFITSHVGRGTFISFRSSRSEPAESGVSGPIEFGIYRAPVPQLDGGFARMIAALADSSLAAHLLGSAPNAGMDHHREVVAHWLRGSGLEVDQSDIVITNGGQHAVMAALSGLTAPTARIATEELTDPRMKAVAAFLGRSLVGISCDGQGMLPDDLDRICRRERIAGIYCTPRYQNPTNVSLPYDRREAIVDIARRHDLKIIESDIYGTIAGNTDTPLRQMAPERTYLVSSFGRIAGAGMKVGWLVGPPGLLKQSQIGVAMSTGFASPIMVELACRMVSAGLMQQMLRWQQAENRHRLSILRKMPNLCDARGDPASGHVWLNLPDPWRAEDLVEVAARELSVNIAPSHTFVVGRKTVPHAIRLVISAPESQEQLTLACERLDRLIAEGPRPSAMSG